ncbi:hypothetical protein B0A49_11249 [Cryomyces minteri]|uniref:C2H2-type domain-containing protein n=1 Tax=Cryomyces minteri TaxID=331657 RepID=A0A4U0WLJ1_9PEZI|nr:hypothetical protein B0A49_11249 [Cryomyces minteri]
MASATRPGTPAQTTSLSGTNTGPYTSTSISSSIEPLSTNSTENPNPLNPKSAHPISQSSFANTGFTAFSPKTSKQGPSPLYSPPVLTGAAALADERRRREQAAREHSSPGSSPNPAAVALTALIGGAGSGMSTLKDTPTATTKLSEPVKKVAEAMSIPDPMSVDVDRTSPASLSSFDSTSSSAALTATADVGSAAGGITAEPASITEGSSYPGISTGNLSVAGGDTSNKAFTFPGPAPPDQGSSSSARGMSLPMSGYAQNRPKSPSTKRHKCPYCSTDFTRHHNLKSHLLTHSQEKPYVCETCQARFRRLHDLKRHTKLHTGERPHTCPKCGRRFARGDALARHNKGQGGCAGRRASFGDDGGDESVNGGTYEGGEDDDDDEQMADDGRRVSEPSSKRHKTNMQAPSEPYRQHSSTYPPVASRVLGSNVRGMYPPGSSQGDSSAATSPRDMSSNLSPKGPGSSISSIQFNTPGVPSLFAPGGMTESPNPLSPGQQEQHRLGVNETTSLHHGRSPSLNQQVLQSQYGRGVGRGTPPVPAGVAGPPPQQTGNTNAPHLPSLPGLAPQPSSLGVPPPSHPPPGASMLHQQLTNPGTTSNPGSHSSHDRNSSSGSMRDYLGSQPHDIWTYVRNLEGRFSRMQDEYELRISRLQEEVISLRGQISHPR